MQFRSQICTTKEQSERLLALGLKVETADCYHWQETDRYGDGNGKWHCEILSEYNKDHNEYLYNVYGVDGSDEGFFIPAWSLHRLLVMLYEDLGECMIFFPNPYEEIIADIERVIEQGYFNKDYLEDKK
jgi:hypothetical protein